MYPGAYDEDALLNLTYLTYVLSKVNDFEVVHGYADTHAPILSMAGAMHTGTGWFSNLRQFSFKPFQDSAGRAPAQGPLHLQGSNQLDFRQPRTDFDSRRRTARSSSVGHDVRWRDEGGTQQGELAEEDSLPSPLGDPS